MDLDELIHKNYRTVRAAGLLRYMLEADHGVTEEPEDKTWTLMPESEFQEFQAWKCHKVQCFLRYAHDTRCLFDCPWRPPCLFRAFQTFRVLFLALAPGKTTVFTRLICNLCYTLCPRSCRQCRNIFRSTRGHTNRSTCRNTRRRTRRPGVICRTGRSSSSKSRRTARRVLGITP